MVARQAVGQLLVAGALLVAGRAHGQELATSATSPPPTVSHDDVDGAAITTFHVGRANVRAGRSGATEGDMVRSFEGLGEPRLPGTYEIRFQTRSDFVRIPTCAGRKKVSIDGVPRETPPAGPFVLSLPNGEPHDVTITVEVSAYEKRIACGEAPREGRKVVKTDGLSQLTFASPHASLPKAATRGGQAVVFVPPGHDVSKPGPLLVGLHPWNGTPWTYAAYRELLDEARARDVVLLFPSGLGNSLYTRAAEEEVMRAIFAVKTVVSVDARRVSIWGASMGGAGATTIAFHRPDQFAFVASYFGDSRYDLSSYVKKLLATAEDAHRVNALDVLENARHLEVWLTHGEADKTSNVNQSAMLADALRSRKMKVSFDRVPGMGHEAPLVVRSIRRVVERAATATMPVHPTRVSYRSVRPEDRGAYGVRLDRATSGDAFIDIEREGAEIVVRAAEGVRRVTLGAGALGTSGKETVRFERKVKPIEVRWASGGALAPEPKEGASSMTTSAPR